MGIRKRVVDSDDDDMDSGYGAPNRKIKKLKRHAPKSSKFELGELGETIEAIQSNFGKDVASILRYKTRNQERIRTGVFVLDLALCGGWMTSRGSMLYGERSAGKSTVAMLTAIEAQHKYPDKAVAWIDIEGTFDEFWFEKLGGDMDRLVLLEPESGEQAVDIADAVTRSLQTCMVVTDSIAMLVPMKEIEASAEDSLPGVHARLVGNYLRRLNAGFILERHRGHNVLILHINQFRMKIGMSFGDPRTLPGGKALEFCTSQQVEIKNREIIDENTGLVKWNEHSFKVTKDKTGGRFRSGKFMMVRDPTRFPKVKGIAEGMFYQAGSILDLGSQVGVVDGKTIVGVGKAAGKDAWMEKFLADPEMYADVQLRIINAFRNQWGLPDLS